MHRTLVVVDMQVFEKSTGHCLGRVVELVRQFREAGDPVVLLEYKGSGNTVAAVRDAVAGYGRCATVAKDDFDGGREVLDACRANGYPPDFVVCGVAHHCCVMHTANTLAAKHPVEVALDCTDADENYEWEGNPRVEATRRFEEAA